MACDKSILSHLGPVAQTPANAKRPLNATMLRLCKWAVAQAAEHWSLMDGKRGLTGVRATGP